MRIAVVLGVLFFGIVVAPQISLGFGDVLFRPLTANPFEGRIGTMVQFGEKDLRLDIGNTVDLMTFSPDDSITCSTGADFFTFTRLRSVGNFKFPVETSDYYFGLNGAITAPLSPGWQGSARLRFAHISSHLVDGLTDSSGTFTKQLPFVYSREFFDLVVAAEHNGFRAYCGLIYVYARIPRSAEPLIPQAGMDFRHAISEKFDVIAGYDFKLVGIEGKYAAMHAAQAGILWKTSPGKGISFNTYIFDGRSIHGMFFRERDSYIGAGFQVHF